MRGIVDAEFCKLFAKLGGFPILHRFYDTKDEWYYEAEKVSEAKLFGLSVGMNDYKIAQDFIKFNPQVLLLDLANSYTQSVLDFCKILRKLIDKESPKTLLMAGNVATYQGVENLRKANVDLVRVGIGGGCFAPGTRILMSNGYYKNIEEINVEDEIIDGNGNPTKVIGIKRTGYRKVIKYRHNKFYKSSICTAEHLHKVYDLNDYAEKTAKSGISSLLKKKNMLWKPIYDLKSKDFLVFPKNIYFNIKNSFTINLLDFAIKDSTVPEKSKNIKPSYSLGYIFGTFLGDGCANLSDVQREKTFSEVGSLCWIFGEKENVIADKVISCCTEVFGKSPHIAESKTKNITLVQFHYQVLARFFQDFGKKNEKHLPEKYFCNDTNYLSGIIDGLVDSDGHIEKYGRYGFNNNSPYLIELFNICNFIIKGVLPSNIEKEKRSGGFSNANLENYETPYMARVGTTCNRRNNEFYNVVDFLDKEYLDLVLPVYDIEVESEDHSFIANNAVVHNSLCSTRNKTAIAVPQLSAIMDCSKSDAFIINDGGIRNCYDEETEVLTKNGWKFFKDISYDDLVCTLNKNNNCIEYQYPTNIIESEHNGKMYNIKTDFIDLSVTPNHKMFICKRDYKTGLRDNNYHLEIASNCYGKHIYYKKDGIWKGKKLEHKTIEDVKRTYINSERIDIIKGFEAEGKDWIQFFAFWLAQGWASKGKTSDKLHNRYRIGIAHGELYIIDYLCGILRKWGLNPHVSHSKNNKCHILEVNNEPLFRELEKFGKSYSKYIPEYIKEISSEEMQEFILWFWKGDGNHSSKSKNKKLFTCSKILADDFSELALKSGKSANIQFMENNKRGLYTVSIIDSHNLPEVYLKNTEWRRNKEKEKRIRNYECWSDYVGKIYCVTVDNHIIYVRRGGKTCWSGNSGDAVKALVAGSDAIMCGGILAQTYESPCENTIFGMASRKLMDMRHTQVKSVEGIEKFVEKKMSLKDFVEEFSWGIRSAGTYLNARNIEEMRNNAEFIKLGKGTLVLDKN
jgi:IMP dehydrogenase/GMP reductase